jgi:hypothetical protein
LPAWDARADLVAELLEQREVAGGLVDLLRLFHKAELQLLPVSTERRIVDVLGFNAIVRGPAHQPAQGMKERSSFTFARAKPRRD